MQPIIEKVAIELAALLRAAILDISPQRNNLSNSELVKSVEERFTENSIEIWAYEYAIFIDSGRKAGARRVPLWALVDWIKRYNLSDGRISVNSLAFLIQRSIFENGIKPRPYLDKYTTDAVELITVELVNEFTIKLLRTFDDLYKK